MALVVLVLILGPFTYNTAQMLRYYESKNPVYHFPRFSDFWVCLAVAALWKALEYFVNRLFYPVFWRLARDQGDPLLQPQRQ